MKTVEQAREALVAEFGYVRTGRIEALIDAKIAAARKPLPPYDGWRVGQDVTPEDTAKGGERKEPTPKRDAPTSICVDRDEDGFWTCREAMSGSPEYVRRDIARESHEKALADIRVHLDKQMAYAIDLQRVIEDLCDNRNIQVPETTARYHYEMAVKFRSALAEKDRRIGELEHDISRHIRIASEAQTELEQYRARALSDADGGSDG